MANLQEWLQEGLRLHKAGNLSAAEGFYRKVLAKLPKQVDALYLLGRLKYQQGDPRAAAPLLRDAVKVDAQYALAHLTLALVAEQLGQDDEAIQHFREACRLDPKSAQPRYNLGNILARVGQESEAEKCLRMAVELDPGFVAAHNNLGLLYQRTERWQEALESLAKAIELDPTCVAAYSNRANLLKQMGRIDDAIALQRRAVQQNASSSDAYHVLGRLLREAGDYAGAEEACQRAVDCDPRSFTAWNELGKTFQLTGKTVEAEKAYRSALALDGKVAETWNNLGTAVLQQQRLEESFALYQKAVDLDPKYAGAWSNLGNAYLDCDDIPAAARCLGEAAGLQKNPFPWELRRDTLCPSVYASVAEIEELRARTLDALERHRSSGRKASLRELLEAACQPSFNFPFHGLDDRPLKEAFASVFAPMFSSEPPPLSNEIPHVGVLITYDEWAFRRSVGTIFDRMDTRAVKITVICSPGGIAKLKEFFTNPAIRFLPMSLDVERTAADIRAASIDILYHWEVATTALSYFMPFLRLAPIQVTSWGIQVTSGIPAMDYYVSSALVETEESDRFYSEQLYRLKTMMSCQPRLPAPVRPEPREAFGLTAEDHVYLCPQQFGKFHPDYDPILREILERDPQGKLVIIEGKHARMREKLMQRFRTGLGTAAERVHFVPRLQGERYTSLFQNADLLLDPLHFGGVNTTYDALSLNKAVLTLPSRFFRCRYTLGCYTQIGYRECVASSPEEYIEKGLRLGTDGDYRRTVAAELAGRTHQLFDHLPSIVELQEFFVTAHARARRGEGKADWLPQLETLSSPVEVKGTIPAIASETDEETKLQSPEHVPNYELGAPVAVTFFEPSDPAYAAAWREVASLVGASLESLGVPVHRLERSVRKDCLNLLIGVDGVYAPPVLQGARYIAYRLLPGVPSESQLPAATLAVLRGAVEVWDFSAAQLPLLGRLGVGNVRHVPIGYHESMRKFSRLDPTIDVVLLASRNGRQAEIYHRLAGKCRIVIAGHHLGAARDQLLASGKVILSVSNREGAVVDEPSLGYLLANRCCVVAESGPELPFAPGIAYADYDELAARCLALVASNQDRYRLSKAGYETFRRCSMPEILRAALRLSVHDAASAEGGRHEV